MIAHLKSLVKQTAIYSIGNISTKLVGLVLLPLYTKHLSVDEFGILAILEITSQILIGVFAFNLHTAMLRWVPEEKSVDRQKEIIFTATSTIITIAILLFLISYPFTNEFSNLFFHTSNYKVYFQWLFISSSIGVYNFIPTTILRLKEKSVRYTIIMVLKFTLTLLATIYFVVFKNMGVEGVIVGQLLGQIIVVLFTLDVVFVNSKLKFDVNILKEMFAYGLPLMVTLICGLIFTLSDRYVINFVRGSESVGFYSFAFKIAGIINVFFIQSFQTGYVPIAFKRLNSPNSQRFYSKILTYYVLVLVIAMMAMSLFGYELLYNLVENKEYMVAFPVVTLLAISMIFKGMQYVISLGFQFAKKNAANAYIIILITVVNLVANYFFVQYFDYMGAAFANLFSYVIMVFLTYKLANSKYYIPYESVKITKMIILGILLISIPFIISFNSLILSVCFKAILFISFPVLLYFLGFFEKIEIETLKKLIKKILLKF